MTAEENIFVIKRNIVDYIWKSARLEGIRITYADTEAICNGGIVSNLKADDVVAINNLKHAWQFVIESVKYPIDFPYICEIHKYVGSNLIRGAGSIRNVPVSIGGTTWKPDMPIESKITEELVDILRIESPTERGITLMLHIMRRQMFLDGNKRTSMFVANHVMISSGAGIITIPIEYQRDFTALLIRFYETYKKNEIINYVYEHCIDGIEFR
ncbi:Fic family protein [Desulfosporosinus sp. I2]|uniref:Fic family protein n=1 Tax=Desulfosporosinus sp. I2 TaxID=1617025 RepID=UPI0018CE954D|nr:Fic family protein [Desulfosporosinus sp. I2]